MPNQPLPTARIEGPIKTDFSSAGLRADVAELRSNVATATRTQVVNGDAVHQETSSSAFAPLERTFRPFHLLYIDQVVPGPIAAASRAVVVGSAGSLVGRDGIEWTPVLRQSSRAAKTVSPGFVAADLDPPGQKGERGDDDVSASC